MAEKKKMALPFVTMTSIKKTPTFLETNCSDWIATEKVHGAGFQFFTNDGENIYLASRRNVLDTRISFQKCPLGEFRSRHYPYVNSLFRAVEKDDRWAPYRSGGWVINEDDEEDEEEKNDECVSENGDTSEIETESVDTEEQQPKIEVRIYGELYGGGGVNKDIKPAVQKEIIYSDDFRFYVFAISINQKWTTIAEMNDLCRDAGFPYYATPVCEPKATLAELKDWLETSGFMKSKSRLTERTDNFKTLVEGVVMTPLTRKGFRFYPIKQLSEAFNDVRHCGKGQNNKLNYCTKARYHSVISKLDIHERENTDMVVEMYIEDVLQESGETNLSNNKRKGCIRMVTAWLVKDGYIQQENVGHRDESTKESKRSHVEDTAQDSIKGVESDVFDTDSISREITSENQEQILGDICGLFD